MTNIQVDVDDFQIKIWQQYGRLYFNIYLHGRKAIPLLKQITFKDAKKEWKRKLLIEQIEAFMR